MKLYLILFLTCFITAAQSQTEINNLILPEGTPVLPNGEFGKVEKVGKGTIKMILIADVGFGGGIYDDFVKNNIKHCTMYKVTLPGSDKTSPPAMPESSTSYSKLSWLLNAQQALLNLIDREKLERPILVGNLIISSWIVLNTALRYPQKFGKIILMSAMPVATWPSMKDKTRKTPVSFEERAPSVDGFFAPRIIKPMTLEKWRQNLYQPVQYVKDSLSGTAYFESSKTVPIPVLGRYLCEFYTTDVIREIDQLKVPMLLLIPGYDEEYLAKHSHYRDKEFFADVWEKVSGNNIRKVAVPGGRIFLWKDQAKTVKNEIRKFSLQKK